MESAVCERPLLSRGMKEHKDGSIAGSQAAEGLLKSCNAKNESVSLCCHMLPDVNVSEIVLQGFYYLSYFELDSDAASVVKSHII